MANSSTKYEVIRSVRKDDRLHEYIGRSGEGPVHVLEWSGLSGLEVENLREQAEQLRLVDHPGLVRFRGFEVRPDGATFLFDPLEEESGLERIGRFAPMSPMDQYKYLRDILGAVQTLHDAGLMHGNVHPENVSSTGAAWMLGPPEIHPGRQPAGTNGYQAYEQDFAPEPAMDQYGAAATLVHLIGHVHPDDFVLSDKGLNLRDVQVTRPFKEVLERMLSSQATVRFASAYEARRAGTRALTKPSWERYLLRANRAAPVVQARVADGVLRVDIGSRLGQVSRWLPFINLLEFLALLAALTFLVVAQYPMILVLLVVAGGAWWMFDKVRFYLERRRPFRIEVREDGWTAATKKWGKVREISDEGQPNVMTGLKGQVSSDAVPYLEFTDYETGAITTGFGLPREELSAIETLLREFRPDEEVLDESVIEEDVILDFEGVDNEPSRLADEEAEEVEEVSSR